MHWSRDLNFYLLFCLGHSEETDLEQPLEMIHFSMCKMRMCSWFRDSFESIQWNDLCSLLVHCDMKCPLVMITLLQKRKIAGGQLALHPYVEGCKHSALLASPSL
jgi:hypothetical protein